MHNYDPGLVKVKQNLNISDKKNKKKSFQKLVLISEELACFKGPLGRNLRLPISRYRVNNVLMGFISMIRLHVGIHNYVLLCFL